MSGTAETATAGGGGTTASGSSRGRVDDRNEGGGGGGGGEDEAAEKDSTASVGGGSSLNSGAAAAAGSSSASQQQQQQQQQQYLEAAITHFNDAMSLIDENLDEGKRCYLKALRICPQVARNETPPILFLRACNWDPWSASKKMCDYWRERVNLFGTDRAYFPITAGFGTSTPAGMGCDQLDQRRQPSNSTMRSALTEQEIEILDTGSVQVLPPDREGRTVVFMDRSRLKPHMHHMTRPRLRALWYVLQKAVLPTCVSAGGIGNSNSSDGVGKKRAATNGNYKRKGSNNSAAGGDGDNDGDDDDDDVNSSTNGQKQQEIATYSGSSGGKRQNHRIVFLALACRPPATGYDWEYPKGCRLFIQVFPLQCDEIHLLTVPATSGSGRLLQAVITSLLNMCTKYIGSSAIVHYGAVDSTTTAAAAIDIGSSNNQADPSNNLPQARLLRELKQHGFAKKGLPVCAGGNFGSERFANWLSRQRCSERYLYMSASELEIRKRQRNNAHSRQKRQRRQQELEKMQNEVSQLKAENAQAKCLNTTLERLLLQAREIAADLGTTTASSTPMESSEAAALSHYQQQPATSLLSTPQVSLSTIPGDGSHPGTGAAYDYSSTVRDSNCFSETAGKTTMYRFNSFASSEASADLSTSNRGGPVPPNASLPQQEIDNDGLGGPLFREDAAIGIFGAGQQPHVSPGVPDTVAQCATHQGRPASTAVAALATKNSSTYSPFASFQAVFPFLATSTNYSSGSAALDHSVVQMADNSLQPLMNGGSGETISMTHFPEGITAASQEREHGAGVFPMMATSMTTGLHSTIAATNPSTNIRNAHSHLFPVPAASTAISTSVDLQQTNRSMGIISQRPTPSLQNHHHHHHHHLPQPTNDELGEQQHQDHGHLSLFHDVFETEENGWTQTLIQRSTTNSGEDVSDPTTLLEPLEQTENIFP